MVRLVLGIAMYGNHDEYHVPDPARFPITVLSLGLFLPPIGYFAYQGDYVLSVALGVVAVLAISGFRLGLLRIVGSLAGMTLAVLYAPQLGQTYAPHFHTWLGTTGLTNRFIAIAAIGLLITSVTALLFVVLSRRLFELRPRADALNRWTGYVVGAGQGVLAMWLLIGGVLLLDRPHAPQSADRQPPASKDAPVHRVDQWVDAAKQQIETSQLGNLVADNNPFERVPALSQFQTWQRTALTLKDPAAIDGLLRHPDVVRLQQNTAVRAAIAELQQDEQIREILDSDRPLDPHRAIQLLNHQKVMQLVDQPEFLETVQRVIRSEGLE
ncbi:CvpA family protein [Roseimaritima sediminicola]|uniref:CvpA family protein n=1 Tax=Roseimaritima sediminicola TaxID=2662066 RepID=UPI0013872878|nr:CvpA family protein [Roseimaritima sediminicola]